MDLADHVKKGRKMGLAPRRVPATVLSRMSIWIAGLYGIWQGCQILTSTPERFSSPGYATVRDFPAAMGSWGVIALLCGALILTGSLTRLFWVKGAGLLGLSVWCTAFGGGAFSAFLASRNAGPTGPPVYLAYAAAVAVLMLVDESEH